MPGSTNPTPHSAISNAAKQVVLSPIDILFLGTQFAAGQTSLLYSMMSGSSDPKTTIGIDMQVISLGENTIRAYDISHTERYRHFPSLDQSDFKAMFFTVTATTPEANLFEPWNGWITRCIKRPIPKILVINQCDVHWELNLKRWVKFAFLHSFNAIIETSVKDPTNLILAIEQIASNQLATPDVLSIYRYKNKLTETHPNLSKFALSRRSFNSIGFELSRFQLAPAACSDDSLAAAPIPTQSVALPPPLRRTKSISDLSRLNSSKPPRTASFFELQLY
jgi:hypothetical protein